MLLAFIHSFFLIPYKASLLVRDFVRYFFSKKKIQIINQFNCLRIPYFIICLLQVFVISCSEKKQIEQNEILQLEEKQIISNGHKLALTYCQGCHLFPKPALLDTTSWKKVLKAMSYRLGINAEEGYEKIGGMERDLLKMQAVFPDHPLINEADWKELQAYYLENATNDSTTYNDSIDLSEGIASLFIPSFPISNPGQTPLTTLVKSFDDHTLVLGNYQNEVKFYSENFDNIFHQINTNSSPVAIHENEANYLLLCIGNIFPNDLGTGTLHQLPKSSRTTRFSKTISENLVRPVYMSVGALSTKNAEDIVVSNFGYYTGNLSYFSPNEETYKSYQLNNEPGANKTIIEDIDKDGNNDILALKGQGNEGIFAYINNGNNTFKEKPLLQFPPVYGSSYFELIDFNNDGYKDLIYVNGDNADYSPILKPYHGVRLFLNKGDFSFKEEFFIPIHGASKSITHDFDQDGDLDIAVIAFFPDFDKTPHHGFVYIEQKSPMKFEKQYIKAANQGRWLCMDKGDFDQDGDTDLVLGNFIYSELPVPDTLQVIWSKAGHEIMFLENGLIKEKKL